MLLKVTGSASARWTLHVRAGGCNRGGSLREGSGYGIGRDTRPGGRLGGCSALLALLGENGQFCSALLWGEFCHGIAVLLLLLCFVVRFVTLPRCSHALPALCPRCSHAVPTLCPRCAHAVPTLCPRCSHAVPTLLRVSPPQIH